MTLTVFTASPTPPCQKAAYLYLGIGFCTPLFETFLMLQVFASIRNQPKIFRIVVIIYHRVHQILHYRNFLTIWSNRISISSSRSSKCCINLFRKISHIHQEKLKSKRSLFSEKWFSMCHQKVLKILVLWKFLWLLKYWNNALVWILHEYLVELEVSIHSF